MSRDHAQNGELPTASSSESTMHGQELEGGQLEDGQMTPNSTMDRIKSLTDFQLYLSPSRAAHVDLLLDSEDDTDTESASTQTKTKQRTKSFASFKSVREGFAPRSSLLSSEEGRSYSALLQSHHAQGLNQLTPQALDLDPIPPTPVLPLVVNPDQQLSQPSTPTTPPENVTDSDDSVVKVIPLSIAHSSARGWLPVAAFDRALNPMFGYPAIYQPDRLYSHSPQNVNNNNVGGIGSVLKPRYGRKRKRDLVKTLLFLFLLRLSSLRVWLEGLIGRLQGTVWRTIGLGLGYSDYEKMRPDDAFGWERGRSDVIVHPLALDTDLLWTAILLVIFRASWKIPVEIIVSRLKSIKRAITLGA